MWIGAFDWVVLHTHSRSLITSSRWVCGCMTCLLMEHWIELNSSDVWPSMVTHTQNLCSSFNPSKCTHIVVNTHTANTHPEQWGAVGGLVPWSRVSPQSRYRRWRKCPLFTPSTNNSCRTRDSNPQPRLTSPTLYPLGHDTRLYTFY